MLRAGDDDEPLLTPAGGEIALAVVQGDKGVRIAVEKQDGQVERRHAGRGIDGCEVQPIAVQDAHADARKRLLQPARRIRAVAHGVRDLELEAGVAAVGHDAGKLPLQLRELRRQQHRRRAHGHAVERDGPLHARVLAHPVHPLGNVIALELAEREALALAQAVRALVDEQQVAAAGGVQRRKLGAEIMLGVAVVAMAEDDRGMGVGHAVEPRVQARAVGRRGEHILVRLLLHGSDAGAHARERRPALLGVGRPALLAQDVLLPRGRGVCPLRHAAE